MQPFRPNDSYDKNDALNVVIDAGNGWHKRYPVRGYHRKGVLVRVAKKGHAEGEVKLMPYRRVLRFVEPWK